VLTEETWTAATHNMIMGQ